MNMEQRAAMLAEILRLEGLIAYAETHGDLEELQCLKERLSSLIEQV